MNFNPISGFGYTIPDRSNDMKSGMGRKEYIYNPKLEGSGLLGSSPQTTECPRNCPDCFAKNGRAYASLPNNPAHEQSIGKIVRVGDISDAFHEIDRSLYKKGCYKELFFNTSYPAMFNSEEDTPIVLTVNPGEMRDKELHIFPDGIPANLMFVRVLATMWNLEVVECAVDYYCIDHSVPVVITWFAFYETAIPEKHKTQYEYMKRTLNSYWCIKSDVRHLVETRWDDCTLVYSCGHKGSHKCKHCGNCLREYYACREKLKNAGV